MIHNLAMEIRVIDKIKSKHDLDLNIFFKSKAKMLIDAHNYPSSMSITSIWIVSNMKLNEQSS